MTKHILKSTTQEIPFGYCHCGCGRITNIITSGPNKHQPRQFIRGHGNTRPPEDRFWERIKSDPATGCWNWTGTHLKQEFPYGTLSVHGKGILAHRFSYELHYGPIPDGLDVCHTCDNPSCVNPAHLWLGTAKDNAQDMARKGRWNNVLFLGEAHPNSKLTNENVIAIRRLRKQGVQGIELAKQFNVTPSTISCIVLYKTWKHIP